MTKTVVGLYETPEKAAVVVDALVAAGFPRDDISVLARDERDQAAGTEVEEEKGSKAGEGAGTGAGIGAVVGGVGGILAGLGMMAIPGVGLVAAGPIAAGLTGAVGGAVVGGIIGGLIGLGIPEEEAHTYAEGVRRGHTLVTVRAADEIAPNIADIMNRHDPIDVNTRAEQWRREGWTGRYDEKAPRYSGTIPVTEEKVTVGKREVASGGVRVHSRVVEEPVREKVQLRDEKVTVERRPTDRVIGAGETPFEERDIEMHETSEEAVVGKQARVTEEIHLGKEVGEHEETINETERKTKIDIERTPEEKRPHR